MAGHLVTNQPPPLAGYDLFRQDAALVEAVHREGAGRADDRLSDLGTLAGSEEAIGWGFDANRNPPELHTHDRYGNRIDEVRYHPSYHRLMAAAVERGLHAAPWRDGRRRRPGGPGRRLLPVEPGGRRPRLPDLHDLLGAAGPATMPGLVGEWGPRLTSLVYDPSSRPAPAKAGALAGMAMTEKQGGSDVRANTTVAVAGGTAAATG